MLRVPDLKTLKRLKKNNKVNDLALVEETRCVYIWDGAAWKAHTRTTGINMSLYDLNRSVMTGLPEISETNLQIARSQIRDYIDKENNKWFMLLCNDRRYYTVFNLFNGEGSEGLFNAEDEIIECLQGQGIIKEISLTEKEDAIECWVTEDNQSYVYYLFRYDGGVILCK